MNTSTKIRLGFAILALSALTACGGGGGGGGGGVGGGNTGGKLSPPVFTLSSATVAPAQETAELQLDLDLQGTAPVLMQFDIEIGSEKLALQNLEGIRALQDRGVDFERLDAAGRTIRVIFGDAGRTDAIDGGGIVRLRFDVDQTRDAGTVDIQIKNIVVADAEGNAVARDDLAAATVTGKINLQ